MSIRVLLADDHTLVRAGLRKILESAPQIEVIGEVADGPAALERLAATAVDVLVLDLTMPGMDGEEVARALLAIEPQACILLMSGYSEQSAMQGLAGEGVRGFLHKPFRPNELIRKVRSVIEG